MQIIHAVKTWFWIEDSIDRRAEPTRGPFPINPVDLGVFIAYFPTWLKYHELYRLGAYGHPYDFISTNYENDLNASQEYQVRGTGWEERFATLGCSVNEPFALLTPAMQDGSALGGPFLPANGLSLTEIHEMMHLGSIWSMGPPIMPAVLAEIDGKKACYSRLAFPDHWYKEVCYNDDIHCLFSSNHDLCDMSKAIKPLSEDDIEYLKENSQFHIDVGQGVVHIGARMGSPFNPGWTTQLPAKDNTMACVDYEPHWCARSTGLKVYPVITYITSPITDSTPSLLAKQRVLEEEVRKLKAKNTQITEENRKLQNQLGGKERDLAQSRHYLAVLRDTFNRLEVEGSSF